MAKYTTDIKTILENGVDLFDFNYPIFDENYRGVLEKKIIDRYYFREIGLETVGQFKHFLKMKMNEIMPYYNKLYETEGLVTVENYNINLDNKITKTNKVDTSTNSNTTTIAESESNGTSKDKTEARQIFSDTPQGKLNDLDYATNLTDNETDGTSEQTNKGNATTTDTGTGTLSTIEEYTEHLLGNGSMRYNADILQEWRDTFLNVDVQVLDELNDLFMNIY